MRRHWTWCGLMVALMTAGAEGHSEAQARKASIPWKITLQSALDEAKKTGKPIMVDFHATWCPPCHLLDKNTFSNSDVIKEASKWVPLKIDVDNSPKLAEKYKVKAMPTIAFLKPDGSIATGFEGYVEPHEMLKTMKTAYGQARKK